VDWLSDWVIELCSRQDNFLGASALAVSAMFEYLFPPFPGDTITLFGAVLITAYAWSFVTVFSAVMIGSMVGAMAAFYVGAAVQVRRDRRLAASASTSETAAETGARARRRASRRELIDRVIAGFHRYGPVFLLLNRFLPGFRAVFFVAAGMAKMRPSAVFLYGAISAGLWNLLVIGLGALVGANLETLTRWMTRYATALWILAGLATVALVARWWLRRSSDAASS